MGESLFSHIGSSANWGHKVSVLGVCIDPNFTQLIHKFSLPKDVREPLAVWWCKIVTTSPSFTMEDYANMPVQWPLLLCIVGSDGCSQPVAGHNSQEHKASNTMFEFI